MIFIQIDSGYYVAGAEFDDNNICVRAAPIIKWMIGKKQDWIENYCLQKNFDWSISNVRSKSEISETIKSRKPEGSLEAFFT